ncbi:MAG: hypothetical protein H7145_12320, partial [Akkermansiaceae bacterium]|nr:hypothetical protein [Armatimonadota bacterium]
MVCVYYVLAFLVGFVVIGGTCGLLAYLVLKCFDRNNGFGILYCLLLGIAATLIAGVGGGFALAILAGAKQGDVRTALLCAGAVVAVGTLLVAGVYAREANTPVRRADGTRVAGRRREPFFADYKRFLRACESGDRQGVAALIDAGMPYVAPAPGAVAKHDRDWAEKTVSAPPVQNGLTIFRLSGLETAAWHGQTEIVAQLLERQTGTTQGKQALRRYALWYARKYGHA